MPGEDLIDPETGRVLGKCQKKIGEIASARIHIRGQHKIREISSPGLSSDRRNRTKMKKWLNAQILFLGLLVAAFGCAKPTAKCVSPEDSPTHHYLQGMKLLED